MAEVSSSAYWRDSFQSIFKSKQLTEYTVMDIEPIMEKDRVQFPGQGQLSYKVSVLVFSCQISNTDKEMNYFVNYDKFYIYLFINKL